MLILRFILIFGSIFALAFLLNYVIFGENLFKRIKRNISPTKKDDFDSGLEKFVENVFYDYMNNKITYAELKTLFLNKAEERRKEIEKQKKIEFARQRREKLKKIKNETKEDHQEN